MLICVMRVTLFSTQVRLQAMLNFQAEQLAVAEHLWADKTTVRRLKDTRTTCVCCLPVFAIY